MNVYGGNNKRSVRLYQAVSILSLFVVVFVIYLATNPNQNNGYRYAYVPVLKKLFPITKGNESLVVLLLKEEEVGSIESTTTSRTIESTTTSRSIESTTTSRTITTTSRTIESTTTSRTIESTTPSGLHDSKVILVWYPPFGERPMVPRFTFDNPGSYINYKKSNQPNSFEIDNKVCGKCLVTFDHQKLDKSDAVVFHARDINSRNMPQSPRKPNQLFAWWLEESPLNTGGGGNNLKDYFDLIMYIRRSSDVFSPYASFIFLLHMLRNKEVKNGNLFTKSTLSKDEFNSVISKLPKTSLATVYDLTLPTISKNLAEFIKKKSRMAVWIVSNCGARLRFDFYNSLKSNGLKVDVYGKCGSQPFPVKDRFSETFFDVIGRYKFYLAFENSFHCKDYLTEKLWFNSLYSGAVPIIFGPHSEDVAAVLPPKSYIHAEDFANPHELVTYLEYLDRNATAYSEYLEWRDLVNFLDNEGNFDAKLNLKSSQNFTKNQLKAMEYAKPSATGFCGLCRKLNDGMNTTKKIHDIGDYIHNDRPECFNDKLARQMVRL